VAAKQTRKKNKSVQVGGRCRESPARLAKRGILQTVNRTHKHQVVERIHPKPKNPKIKNGFAGKPDPKKKAQEDRRNSLGGGIGFLNEEGTLGVHP